MRFLDEPLQAADGVLTVAAGVSLVLVALVFVGFWIIGRDGRAGR